MTNSPLDSTAPGFEVLRVTGIHKSLGRFRPSLALVYRAWSEELSLRLAVNGSIDNELTTACAQVGLAKLIGVERGFANKADKRFANAIATWSAGAMEGQTWLRSFNAEASSC